MKALRYDETLRFDQGAPVPRNKGEALIQVLTAGICNTDLEIIRGYGGFRGILGHEFVGRVVESPDGFLKGRRVVGEINVGCNSCAVCLRGDTRHCAARTVLGIVGRDGTFAEFISLPIQNLIEVPDSLPDEVAVFTEPLAAACQVLDQVNIDRSQRVAVIGDGKLGQLIIRVLARTGCDLTAIGKHEEKLDLARAVASRALRIDTTNGDSASVAKGLLKEVSSDKFDVVIDASGSASGLPIAINLVKPLGRIVLKSTHHKETPLQISDVVVNEITIIGSRCGRFQPALDLLISESIDVQALISESFPLEEGVAAFQKAAGSTKVLLRIA